MHGSGLDLSLAIADGYRTTTVEQNKAGRQIVWTLSYSVLIFR